MMKDIQIKLNPYLANSKNLIDYFGIIGYDEKIIFDYTLNIKEQENNLILSVLSEEKLDSFTDYAPDYIKKQIYPENPIILDSNSDSKPKVSNIVFYSCYDSLNDNKKIIHCYFAFKFYENYINQNNKKEYYIPKSFVIISQFPYFTLYSKICSFLIDNKKKDEIPKEIIIHYLINYIPSPINNRLIFDNFKSYSIPKITGFPYIDFNMFEVINLISINDLIKIYILILLEFNFIFFSPNHEKLNIFMIMLYILDYPLNDTLYFGRIRTISLESFKDNPFFTAHTEFFGINAKFDYNLDLPKQPNYFIVDLEESKNLIKYIGDNPFEDEEIKLLKYIDNILNNKNIKSNFH